MSLQCLDIANKGDEPDTVMNEVKGFEISADRKKMLVRKADDFYILDSDAKGASLNDPKALGKTAVNLSRWTISTNPRDEFRGIFLDAWRMERDFFYDPNMHGVNWPAMRDRYLPLVDRVADRDELNDVIAQMAGELSALHTFVFGGDAAQARRPDRPGRAGRAAAPRRKGRRLCGRAYLRARSRSAQPGASARAPRLARQGRRSHHQHRRRGCADCPR